MPYTKVSAFWAYLYSGLLVLYAYLEMQALQTATYASPLLAAAKFSIIIIAIYIVALKGGFRYKTTLSRFWVIWIIWLILEFTLFFNSGSGISFLHCFFAPFCFLLVLYYCIMSPENEDKIVAGFVILYLLTGAYSVYLSFYIGTVYWETGKLVSNLVFWPLCAFVFVPVVKKQLFQYLLLVPMIIVTLLLAKRSAMIIIALEVVIYSFYQLRNSKKKARGKSLILYLIIAVIAVVEISSRFSSFTDSTFSRFETIQEDQGSGRIEVYQTALNKINEFSPLDYLVGRGYGSIVEINNSAAHNDALQLFYEFGIVALFLYIAFIILLFLRIKIVKKYAREYLVGYLFCIITIIVLGLFSNLIPFNSYFAFICSYLGMTEAAVYKSTHQTSIV